MRHVDAFRARVCGVCAGYARGFPALYWEVSAQGFDRKPPSESLGWGLEVSREYLMPKGGP
ncbi:MAG: hypothetical protein ACLSHC_09645 [Bilophila wadsworthia]